MKRIISALLLLAMTLSLFSCHRVISSVKFVVDGEVIETYSGSSENVKFPTPKEKEGMVFYGWLTDEYLDDNLVTEENIGKHFGFWPTLTLYAHYIVDESQGGTPIEPNPPTEPDADSNVDQGGWT